MPVGTHAVSLRRLLQDGVAVEPQQAVAILETIWSVTAATVDERGCYLAVPLPGSCLLTAFGDVEVEPSAGGRRATCGPVEVTTALCRVLVRLTSSGRVGDATVPSTTVEVLQAVRTQAAGGRVAFATPDALFAACDAFRGGDGSVALAHLYARWEIASASAPPWTEPQATQPPAPPVFAASSARPLQPGLASNAEAPPPTVPRVGVSARIAAAAAAAVMLILIGAGAANFRRTSSSGGESGRATHAADPTSDQAGAGDAGLEPGGASVSPSLAKAGAVPAAPAPVEKASESPRATAPAVAVPASTSTAPRRMVRAADVGATPYSPSFARSTGSLVFHSGIAGTGLHEASLRGDGTIADVKTLVRDGANNYHVQISPDGTRLAFDSDKQGDRAVYVANRDGSGARRVSGDGVALVPSWSPDGTRLAFVRADRRRPRVWQLWTLDLRTNRLQQRTSHQMGQPWGGSWFPDGRRITYSLEDRLVVLDLNSGTQRVYASPVPGRLVRTPAVSPDGGRIAFQVRQSGMWMLDVASGETVRVLADRSAQEFAWSPDGRSLAYHTARGGGWEIWAVDVGAP